MTPYRLNAITPHQLTSGAAANAASTAAIFRQRLCMKKLYAVSPRLHQSLFWTDHRLQTTKYQLQITYQYIRIC